jgi:two-component system chemotaxis response regulator CheB
MIRVLVVDDSGFMRIALRQIIEAEGDLQVVGEARTGAEAVQMARELKPDVVTMDVEMPEMDGIEATRRIMADSAAPPRIVMVSNHTQAGADAAIKALGHGAVDFLSKSTTFVKTDLGMLDTELRAKLRIWGERRVPPRRERTTYISPPPPPPPPDPRPRVVGPTTPPVRLPEVAARPAIGGIDLVVIAVSTGGPQTLPDVLTHMGRIAAPVVIAQHMPELFTHSFAQHLRDDTGLDVREGAHRMDLPAGSVTLIPGGRDGILARAPTGLELRLCKGDGAVHPSADMLFQSAAGIARHPLAVILTGMGSDGTKGAAYFQQRKLWVLAQTPETCVVGGMPQSAIEAGVATDVLALEQIGAKISHLVSSSHVRAGGST